FKDVKISCEIIRFADDFIVISGSPILLDIIKIKINKFLTLRGLEIHPNKSRTLTFSINNPFNFLGYTFVYLIQTKHIRCKFLMSLLPALDTCPAIQRAASSVPSAAPMTGDMLGY